MGAWRRAGATALALTAAAALLLGCGSSSSEPELGYKGTAYPNVDTASSRHVTGPIKGSTVADLALAWTVPLTAQSSFGAHSSPPLVSEGVVYSQDLESNVQAIDLESGEVLWTKKYELPDEGPNGVVLAGGRVYGATPNAAFALDAETGKQLWTTTLTTNSHEGIDIAPGYHDGLVYVSTVPVNVSAAYKGDAVGILWALDAKTGKKAWKFNTVPDTLWSKQHADVNSGGGVWYTPSFDDKGFIYFGTGNPAPFPGTPEHPWGSSRPGPNLYTNSIVKLDAKTGKLQWYHQLTPHDVYDWDLQDSPILIEAGGKQLAITAGKSGIVLAVDQKTGKPVWQQPVGKHNGHDKDGLYAMRGEYEKLKTPMTVYPGTLGGVIAPMATDGSTIFVPVVNHPVTITEEGGGLEESPTLTGELVALDAATGNVKWSQEFGTAAFGAPTVVNDLVFATTFDGTLRAFDTSSGNQAWEETLPAGSNTGVTISDDTVIAPAGIATEEGQTPEIVAFRLGG